ncbi:hypothetical protein FI667_g3255, partial [Globisporangium splendens]
MPRVFSGKKDLDAIALAGEFFGVKGFAECAIPAQQTTMRSCVCLRTVVNAPAKPPEHTKRSLIASETEGVEVIIGSNLSFNEPFVQYGQLFHEHIRRDLPDLWGYQMSKSGSDAS